MAQRQNDDNALWILLLLGGLAWIITRRSKQNDPAPPAADPLPTTEHEIVKPAIMPETATPGYISKNELETYIQATGDTDMKKNWSLYNPIDFVAIQPE